MYSKKAEWTIVHGCGPDDVTEACTEHVGDLLTDAPQHWIYNIEVDNTVEAIERAVCCFVRPSAKDRLLDVLVAKALAD